ncbi:MAG: hypothetical protein KGN37_01725, partial [Burkholderiales bacterium]|nr:hypothetical protein [Burkholderiales bacterium]
MAAAWDAPSLLALAASAGALSANGLEATADALSATAGSDTALAGGRIAGKVGAMVGANVAGPGLDACTALEGARCQAMPMPPIRAVAPRTAAPMTQCRRAASRQFVRGGLSPTSMLVSAA